MRRGEKRGRIAQYKPVLRVDQGTRNFNKEVDPLNISTKTSSVPGKSEEKSD